MALSLKEALQKKVLPKRETTDTDKAQKPFRKKLAPYQFEDSPNSDVLSSSDQTNSSHDTTSTKTGTSNRSVTSTPEGNQCVTSNLVVTSNSAATSNPSSNPSSNQKYTSKHSVTSTSEGNQCVTSNRSVTGTSMPTTLATDKVKLGTNRLLETSERISFFQLKGFQRQIFLAIASLVQNPQTCETPIISIESLLRILNREKSASTEESLKKSIIKIQKKGLIKRAGYSRAGTSYLVESFAYLEWTQFKNITSNQMVTSSSKDPVTHPVTHPVTFSSSQIDSTININSNLTSDLTSKSNLPNWFAQLNFSNVPVQPSQVNPSIRQLVQVNLTRDDVQNFIDRFTSWAATQKRINNPVGMFCEKLKAYAVDGDSDVLLAMTEQDRRQEAEFSAHIEKARLEMELIERARRHEVEKTASEEFETWYASASDDELTALLKPSNFLPLKSEVYKLSIKQTFIEKKNGLRERL